MLTNQQVARAFASGETSGKSLNMFIEKDTIYSYGYHFPIARNLSIGNDCFLFNSNGYSNTTAKHKSHVYSAISGVIIECPKCDITQAEDYIISEIVTAKKKLKRARVEWSISHYEQTIKRYQDMLYNLADIADSQNITVDLSRLEAEIVQRRDNTSAFLEIVGIL